MKRILLYCFFQIIPPVVGSCWATDSDRSSLEEILADIEIPTSDVNFGTLQSEPGTSPPIGPLLQRYYAKKQRSLVIDSRDYAISIYRNFESETCGRPPQPPRAIEKKTRSHFFGSLEKAIFF